MSDVQDLVIFKDSKKSSETIVHLLEEHGDNVVKYYKTYSDEAIDVFEKYDAIIKDFPTTNKDEAIELLFRYGDDVSEGLTKHYDDFMTRYMDEGQEFIDEYLELGDEVFESGRYFDDIYDFNNLSVDEKLEVFSKLSSEEVYEIVKNSNDSWVVQNYDLITPDNAKDFIIISKNSSGDVTFNLDWPKYGGYNPETISSIDDLSGKVFVSRDGGDGGYTMGLGKNIDGTYPNNSQRAIPKTSAEVTTGTFDVDLYKASVDIVVGEGNDLGKIDKLVELGIDEITAEDLIRDYRNWLTRTEIVGENSISDGLKLVGKDVVAKYGYYGKAATWEVANVKMVGGAGQMNTVYTWGTLKRSGIITNVGNAIIN